MAVLAPSMVSDEKSGYFILAVVFCTIFVSGCWTAAAKLKEIEVSIGSVSADDVLGMRAIC